MSVNTADGAYLALAPGLGSMSAWNTLTFAEPPSIIAMVLLVNTPQIILSFLYFAYNGLFTYMLLAEEWSGFAIERKGLRVTSPSSKQRSTYRLQLPYRYGVPLLIVSAVLHWFVSQCFYISILEAYDHDGNYWYDVIRGCGYSPRALLTTICVGTLVLGFGVANGFRTYKPGIPLVGSCSAAISAACHPPQGHYQPSGKAILWGSCEHVAARGRSKNDPTFALNRTPIGHCSLTSFDAEPTVVGALYAGLPRGDRSELMS
ncbi:MAG: hypothetical protein Q9226_006927 [Calogaya cf. arnoldii]